MCHRPLNATENFLKSVRGFYKYLKPSQSCFKLSEASKTVWNVPPLNTTDNLLKHARNFYKCLKPPQSCFKLSGETSRTILEVLVAFKCYWQLSKKCQKLLQVLSLPRTVLICQRPLGQFWKFYRPLNAIKSLLKIAKNLVPRATDQYHI